MTYVPGYRACEVCGSKYGEALYDAQGNAAVFLCWPCNKKSIAAYIERMISADEWAREMRK